MNIANHAESYYDYIAQNMTNGGITITCIQCQREVPIEGSIYRMHRYFCSATCAERYEQENYHGKYPYDNTVRDHSLQMRPVQERVSKKLAGEGSR